MSTYDLLIVSAKPEDVNQYSHMRDSVRATLFGARLECGTLVAAFVLARMLFCGSIGCNVLSG